ncbi:hypothetical protein BGW38_004450 [Lunasporangiospora selenospora]|uniref:Suppressor of white apricot N-terminal domain-containing protein n=1 Tax=Lunasporangiospora selenospora TaxID=979761 RepID=A0A9P6KHI9_9FUNG|nr:hypothetical protein BGW38_004450 [Lunasporangiospora selenospora]
MWKTVVKEEKRIKDLLENTRRRAQRRRAYYESRLGDPMQLLRVSGTASKLVTNPEMYSFHEDSDNLMPWPGDSSVKIDRFDGRALLDFLPSDPRPMVESGLRIERDEDGIGDELRFERWQDLVDKARLGLSEEQCIVDNEEEWNDLVARHHALIGKTTERKSDTGATSGMAANPFHFDYGTKVAQADEAGELGPHSMDREAAAIEEENILDHLDELSAKDRDFLDRLGEEYSVKHYYRYLKIAKKEQESRVKQLKVTAVNLERTMAGKKPLKTSEIEAMDAASEGPTRPRSSRTYRRHSQDSHYRGSRRSSPSYEPYAESGPSRSGSESPERGNVEFIVEFKGSPPGSSRGSHDAYVDEVHEQPTKANFQAVAGRTLEPKGVIQSSAPSSAKSMKMSLAEKLKERMRQGLAQSGNVFSNASCVVLSLYS